MTEKMKCCFCGAELQTDNEIARLIMWRCHTPGCLLNGWHSAEIIQHLIDGKKAQDALKVAINALKYVEKHEEDDYPNDVHYRIDLALRRITSITKQENK